MVRVYQVFGERVHLFVLVGEVCLGYSRARYRRPGPGFDPAHPWFSIRIVWIGGTVASTYTVYILVVPTGARVTSGFRYCHKLFLFTQFCIAGRAFYSGHCRWDNSSQYKLSMESGLETQRMP